MIDRNEVLDDNSSKKELTGVSLTIANSWQTIKRSSFIIKLIFIGFFLSHFLRTFIYVTTNSLNNPKVSDFLEPFYIYPTSFQFVAGIILLFYFYQKKRLNDCFIIGSLIFLLGSLAMGLYEFSPCMFEHSDSMTDHVHPHPIDYILKESFLCPSYSHRSRFHLLFCVLIGVFILMLSLRLRGRASNSSKISK